ncbi:MAG: hypothetical protein ACPL0C_02890 [Candidatus Bathyarchaeales archaeon]
MSNLKTHHLLCNFQTVDNHGLINCLYFDGSIGYCNFELCPRKCWQIRRILRQACEGGLKIKLKGLMGWLTLTC